MGKKLTRLYLNQLQNEKNNVKPYIHSEVNLDSSFRFQLTQLQKLECWLPPKREEVQSTILPPQQVAGPYQKL